MAGLPDWFLAKNVRTPKDLENEKPRLSILNPQRKSKKDDEASPSLEFEDGCEYAVSQYLYEEAYDTVASTFVRNAQNHLQASKGSILLSCKMKGGVEFLDAFVHHLAKDLESNLITIELEDLADLGWELDQRENNSMGWTLEESSLELPDRQTPFGPAYHYFAGRSHRNASSESWNRNMRALSTILDCSRAEDSSQAPVIIQVRDTKRVMDASRGSKILARLRDCVERKRQSGETITIVATLSHVGAPEDGCDCWICEGAESRSSCSCSSCIRCGKYGKLKRKIGATRASTIIVGASDVAPAGEKDLGGSVARVNVRQLKRMLRLRISNCFAVKTLLPDAHWEDLSLESLGNSIWTEEEMERAVARIKGRAWKKPLLDLDDVRVVLKRLEMIPDPEKDGNRPDEKGGGGGPLGKKWKQKLEDVKSTCNEHEKELIDGVVKPEDLQSKFDDVIIDEKVKETIRFLTSMFKFRAETTSHFLLSQIQIKGALLYGPPGTGKTHFSRAIAKESGASMLSIDGSQVTSMWVGETEKYIKAAFTLTTKLAPCVLFIDEADCLFRCRSSEDKSWERSSITQFLTLMDSVKQEPKGDAPFVLVATNRPMDLDDAFLRRLPQKIMIGLPSQESRSKILRLFLKQDDLDPETNIDSIAEQTDGYSGSDLRSLCAEAALLWAIEQQQTKDREQESPVKVKLTRSHFDRALESIRPTVSKQSLRELEEFDRRFSARVRKSNQTKAVFVAIETRTELALKTVKETSRGPSLPHSVAECVDFIYEPLETTQFRVLKIHPGTKGAPLEADLVHASLTDAPQYQALSYTWGSLEPPFYMSCNGVEMRVTKTLHNALCNARREDETLTIWADAVCINQKDVAEKSVQVALMREIYSKACGLFIWLGQPEDPHDATLVSDTFDHLESRFLRILDGGAWRIQSCLSVEALKTLETSLREEFGQDAGEWLNFLEPSQWTKFFQFFLMPWFTRVWVYQEVISIARIAEDDITLAYGNAKISWPRFAVVVTGFISSGLQSALTLAGVPMEQFPMKIFYMIESERTSHWMTLKLPDETLTEDKVCEMIEYATSKSLRLFIVTEYDMEAFGNATNLDTNPARYARIVLDAAKRCNYPLPIIAKFRNLTPGKNLDGGRSGKLQALCVLWPSHEETGSESIERLVPNYRKSTAEVFIDLTLYFIQEELCLDIFELLPDTEGLGVENLPSWAVDLTRAPKSATMVRSASIGADGNRDRGFSNHPLEVAVSADQRQLQLGVYVLCRVDRLVSPETRLPYREVLSCVREMVGETHGDPLAMAKEMTYITGGTVYEAFWRTAACSVPLDPFLFLVKEVTKLDWQQIFEEWHEKMWRTLSGGEEGRDDDLCEEHPELFFEEGNFKSPSLALFSKHRQFCVTKRGFMGWVPLRARAGDTVCIIPGARMPYLIRSTDVEQQWELVGPAYIHGVMEGLLETDFTILSPTLSTKGEEILGPDAFLNICLV